MDSLPNLPPYDQSESIDRSGIVRKLSELDFDPVSLTAAVTANSSQRTEMLLLVSAKDAETKKKARSLFLEAEHLAHAENHSEAARQYRQCFVLSRDCERQVRSRVLEPLLSEIISNDGSIRPWQAHYVAEFKNELVGMLETRQRQRSVSTKEGETLKKLFERIRKVLRPDGTVSPSVKS